jgi:GAF domain
MSDEQSAGLEPDRIARVAAALAVGERDPGRSWCSVCAATVGVTGAGVVLMSSGTSMGNVCASDSVAGTVEEAQYTLGEGPCVDACHAKAPVLVPDLEAGPVERWQEFRHRVLGVGVRAAFGFPLMVREICIGALDLYHDQAGPLTDAQFADAVAVAHVFTRTVLAWQAVAAVAGLAAGTGAGAPGRAPSGHRHGGGPGPGTGRRCAGVVASPRLRQRPPRG